MDFITLTEDQIEREQEDLNSQIESFVKAFSCVPTPKATTEILNEFTDATNKFVVKRLNHLKTINEREKAITKSDDGSYNYSSAKEYTESFTANSKYRASFTKLIGPMVRSYSMNMYKFFTIMLMRKSLLKFYSENISKADPSLFNAKYTMDKAADTLRELDDKSWDIDIISPKGEPYVGIDERSISSYYWMYRAHLKPTWGADVYDEGIALQDIAGKRVVVLDAEQIPYTGPLGGNSKLYLIKVGYSLVPIDDSFNFWGKNYTDQEKIDIVGKTAHTKDLYLMTTELTDGTMMSATGKDDEWAERTLKSRLKRTMLKTMKIL
jgi:hypothetical protein